MFLSCVCFVVICACSYECYWYSMGCGWIQGDFIFIFICYEHSKEKSRFLGNLVLWVISSLHNLVLLVIVWPTLFPWSTLNVKLESMSITIMSKGGKLKPNTSLELYFVNKRNVCAPRPLDVSSARKHACFARESEASFSRSKIYDLDRSIPPQQMFDLRLGFRLSWSLLDSYNLCIAFGYYSIDINIAIYFNLAFTMYMIQINKYVIATYATICNFLKPTNQYSKYSKKKGWSWWSKPFPKCF